jgi:hypothetical protein
VQGLAPWATALERAAGGAARATRTYAENSGFMTLAGRVFGSPSWTMPVS